MNEQDICETAARLHNKLYEFLVMPNGPKCCASIFQQFITEVTDDLDFLFVHLDDILVYSECVSESRTAPTPSRTALRKTDI